LLPEAARALALLALLFSPERSQQRNGMDFYPKRNDCGAEFQFKLAL